MPRPSAAAWRNRIVGSGEEAPDHLTANPRNWRLHPKAQQDALAGALDRVGWVQQVLVNQRSGFVVDGHARVALALTRGEATVPVLYVDLDPQEEALVLATLDPLSAIATTDEARLRELLAEISVDDAGLAALLGSLAPQEPKAGLTDPDDAPPLGAESPIQRGDVFALGDHRLLCGDATEAASYARLLGTERAAMMFTDPPWNVAIGQDTNPRHRQRAGLANDDLPAAEFRALLDGFAAHATAVLEGDLYCVLGASEWPTLDLALRGAGLHWSATIIWAKDLFVLGRSKYHRRYEPLWYGWPGRGMSSFVGGRAEDDVWEIARPRRSEEHPTMKPVELVVRAIGNSSVPGQTVLDPFVGSGTTIIAAEQTGRLARGMEIDPRYIAVTIKRWEDFTGRMAERITDARTTAEAPGHAAARRPEAAGARTGSAARSAGDDVTRASVVGRPEGRVGEVLGLAPGVDGHALARGRPAPAVRVLPAPRDVPDDRRPVAPRAGLDRAAGHEPAPEAGRRPGRQDPRTRGSLRRLADGPAAPPGDLR